MCTPHLVSKVSNDNLSLPSSRLVCMTESAGKSRILDAASRFRKREKGKCKVIPVSKYAPRHEDVWGSGRIAPCIFDFSTRWRSVVSFTLQPPYLRRNRPQYPLSRRLGGPQSRPGRGGVCPCRDSNPYHPFRSLVTILTELPRFPRKGKDKVVPVLLTEHHAVKAYWESGGIAPHILDLGTWWRWLVSFRPRPLYPQGKRPCYPLDRLSKKEIF
jgi:hypothetical protein